MKFTSIFFTASGSIFAVYRKEIKKLRIKIRSFIYFSWFYWLFSVFTIIWFINAKYSLTVGPISLYLSYSCHSFSITSLGVLLKYSFNCSSIAFIFLKDLIFNNKPLTHLNRETKVAFFLIWQ